jgi:hypothetical protein
VPLAKYINSPQTIVYNKSGVLYGFDKARAAIKKTGVAVIVEGNMDCLTSHQFGVENVVAVSGTALTAEQVMMLKKVAKNLSLRLIKMRPAPRQFYVDSITPSNLVSIWLSFDYRLGKIRMNLSAKIARPGKKRLRMRNL